MIIFRFVCSVYTFLKNYWQLSTKSVFYSSFVGPLGWFQLETIRNRAVTGIQLQSISIGQIAKNVIAGSHL